MSVCSAETVADREEQNVKPTLLSGLPSEILYLIFSHLECPSLVSLMRTCRSLRKHVENDAIWENLIRRHVVKEHMPQTAYPAHTYRELYLSQHPYWFLPKNKLWFADTPGTGKLILVRYDPRRGAFEGHTVLARTRATEHQLGRFEGAAVFLHYDRPTVHIPFEEANDTSMKMAPDLKDEKYRPAGRGEYLEGIRDKARLGRKQSPQTSSTSDDMPPSSDPDLPLWPPPNIPAQQRVQITTHDRASSDKEGHESFPCSQISEQIFRLHHCAINFPNRNMMMNLMDMPQEVETWSTLDAALYTPTPEKPYQGIWSGSYGDHGIEFLLVMQRETVADELQNAPMGTLVDEDSRLDLLMDGLGIQKNAEVGETSPNMNVPGNMADDDPQTGETTSAKEKDGSFACGGRIEAVKLTGDSNVPRGEYSWIANDIGPAGFVGIGKVAFPGVRVVRSQGHLASPGFQDGMLRLWLDVSFSGPPILSFPYSNTEISFSPC